MSPRSTSALSNNEPFASPLSSKITSDYPARNTPYPPTRPASPRDRTARFPLTLHESSHHGSNAWSERSTPADGPTDNSVSRHDIPGEIPGGDFGTGVRAGAGYIGMSSGFTLLRAIQKFASADAWISDSQINGGAASVLHANDAKPLRLSKLPISGGVGHGELVLPPHDEIMPLVESFFRYFRKFQPPFASWMNTLTRLKIH